MIELLILCGTTFAVCIAAASIPVINTEIYLIGVASLVSPVTIVPLAIAAAAGAMVGKLGVYTLGRFGGASAHKRLPERWRDRYASLSDAVSERDSVQAVVFVSALVGLPPFYLMSLLAGALRVSLAGFLAVGFVGRALRFGTCLAVPQLVLSWLSA